MKVEEEYLDVLQNIEAMIIQEYRNDPSVLDVDAADAVNALIRHYDAGRGGPRLGSRAQKVYDAVHGVCEWRLGRGAEPGEDAEVDEDDLDPVEDEDGEDVDEAPPLSVDVIVACLRRIHSSILFWNKEAGRQGYLSFVDGHV